MSKVCNVPQSVWAFVDERFTNIHGWVNIHREPPNFCDLFHIYKKRTNKNCRYSLVLKSKKKITVFDD